jgi:hypothetical protein
MHKHRNLLAHAPDDRHEPRRNLRQAQLAPADLLAPNPQQAAADIMPSRHSRKHRAGRRRARSVRIQPSSASTSGAMCTCRIARRTSGGSPLMSRSMAKMASNRRAASMEIGALATSASP